MAGEVASAFVSLIPSAKGFKRGITRQIGGDVDSVGKTQGKKLGDGMLAGLGAGLKGVAGPLAALGAGISIADFFGSAVSEGREAAKVSALTASAIKATGGAAGVTAAQVGALATALSNKVGVDDEAIQSGENLLLTFKNIQNVAGTGNDIFNQATAAAVDLSAAGFGSIESASVMLGKALNDPVKGITALQRVGVTLTQGQKDQVKTLVANGNALGAQKVILGEVMGQVGGAAAAQADPLDKAGVAWGNFEESIGTAILPALGKVANFFTTTLLPALTTFGGTIGPIFSRIGAAFARLGGAFSGGGAGGGGIAAAFQTVIGAFRTLVATVGPIVTAFISGLRARWATIAPFVRSAFNNVKAIITTVLQIVARVVSLITTAISFIWRKWGNNITTVVAGAFKLVAQVVKAFTGIILGIVRTVLALLKGDWKGAWNSFLTILKSAWGGIRAILGTVLGIIRNVFVGAGKLLLKVGKNIVQGLINGIKSIAGKVKDALLGLLPGPLRKFAGMLGISSPSKVFADFGANIGAGLVQGVEGQRRDVERAVARLASTARAGVGQGSAVTGPRSVTIVNNYPAPEKASDTLAASLRRAQFVGAI